MCLAKEKAYPRERGRAGYAYMSCPVSPGTLPASNSFQVRGPPEPLVVHQFSTPYYISPPRTCLVLLEPMQVPCICSPPESSLQICCPRCIILFVFSLSPAGFIWLWFLDTAGAQLTLAQPRCKGYISCHPSQCLFCSISLSYLPDCIVSGLNLLKWLG